jgi:hypothetical protein
LRELGKTPVIDVGTLAQIKAGRITVVGAVDHLVPGGATFGDGSQREYDAIVLATGYRPSLAGFLPDLDGLVDAAGIPTRLAGEGALAGLFFLGFDNHRPGGVLGAIGRDSELIADMMKR